MISFFKLCFYYIADLYPVTELNDGVSAKKRLLLPMPDQLIFLMGNCYICLTAINHCQLRPVAHHETCNLHFIYFIQLCTRLFPVGT